MLVSAKIIHAGLPRCPQTQPQSQKQKRHTDADTDTPVEGAQPAKTQFMQDHVYVVFASVLLIATCSIPVGLCQYACVCLHGAPDDHAAVCLVKATHMGLSSWLKRRTSRRTPSAPMPLLKKKNCFPCPTSSSRGPATWNL